MRSTAGHRRRRRNAVIVTAIAVGALAAWIGVAYALAGGSATEEGGGSGDNSGGPPQPEEAAAPAEPEPTTTRQESSGDAPEQREEEQASGGSGAGGGSGEGSGEGSGRQGSPEQTNKGDAKGDAEGDADVAPSSEQPSGQDDESATDTGDDTDVAPPQSGQANDAALSETEEERVISAAGRFVGATFGYTGDSTGDYTSEIGKAALMQGIYTSPASEVIEAYEKKIDNGEGITSAAIMDDFEITSREPNQVKGTAYFRVGAEYSDDFTDLDGRYIPFSQQMTLCPYSQTYKVCAAEAHREYKRDYTYYDSESGDGGSGGASDSSGKGGSDR